MLSDCFLFSLQLMFVEHLFPSTSLFVGLKAYSNWPTYPQLYVSGEFIGGLDIVKVWL